jgi:hypothetical protein
MKRIAIVVCAAACSAASASPQSFGTTPVGQATSAACNVQLEAFSAPDPLVRGPASIEIVATDLATHAPKTGLAIAIVPFMPAMGHGSATSPTVVDHGGGVYVADDVVMAMPGTWQLRTTIGGGACSDSVVVDVDVQ